MRPVTVTNTATGTTASSVVVTDIYNNGPVYGIQFTVSGTNTSKLQYTNDDVFNTASADVSWYDYAASSGYTTTGAAADLLSIGASAYVGVDSYVVRAWRLNTTAYTDGYAEMVVVQQSTQ